ncbi:MAG: hypothetical protein WEB57_11715 [Pseudohongiellaceae bacterium]
MQATYIRWLLYPLLILLPAGSALASFAGGDGSAAAPWQIANAEQLDAVRHDLNAHYILTADIDLMSATGRVSGAFWNNGAGWEPIGQTLASSFTGSLDGNGFTITGLFIERAGENQAGLFGWIGFGAQLTGMTLDAVNINGGSLVGGLVVTNFGGTIENSHINGSVRGNEFVGGLVARNLSGTVRESSVTGSVSGGDRASGPVGINWGTARNLVADIETAPPVSDLASASNTFPGAVSIAGTGAFDDVRGTGTITSIRLSTAFDPGDARAAPDKGALTFVSDVAYATLLPYRMQQASPGQEAGVFSSADGDIVVVTARGRALWSHPVVADSAVLRDALDALDLELEYGERATMRLLLANGAGSTVYFSARADMLAVPAPATAEEGLFSRPIPGLRDTTVAYLVFTSAEGIRMQQELVPVPADWPAVKNTLSATAGISNVRMDPQGIISVTAGEQRVRGRMEYEVLGHRATDPDKADERATFTPVGDVNGDGTEDFQVRYPNGNTQLLLIFPQPA